MWDYHAIRYLWCEFEEQRRVHESVYEYVFIIMAVWDRQSEADDAVARELRELGVDEKTTFECFPREKCKAPFISMNLLAWVMCGLGKSVGPDS